ncbi:DHA2 family efflux MFS transporter permease subunit [Streptomyces sp. SID2888]|uniref:DHA2 family efflux MFS transporter permease subunit n=1 Tax=Streptomyces sp. SID2888 TaxID=2690256 RepID=UPI00136F72B5|nr:DHA2 family efflux MFS transporter permease subunit [Streptomyces sp. SID2888]MYV46697.1 DHA2 family efflux MFS transporter permease subunit [Streptomyces sp. SID2888]
MAEEVTTAGTDQDPAKEPGEAPAAPEGMSGSFVRSALVLALGAFVALMDTTIVGVALHSFSKHFGASLSDVQWVSTAYLLAMAALTPATAWAAQRFGAAASWTVSLCVFLAGSILCGAAWSIGSLIAFRALQGLGASMLFPLMRILVVQLAGPERMGRMMSLIAIPILVAPVAGPVIGGAVVQDLSWRWAFFLNVPVIGAVIVLSALCLPNSKGQLASRLDIFGLLTMSAGLAAVIFGFSRLGEGRPVTDIQVLLPLLAGMVLLVTHGVRARGRGTAGIVDFGLFRDRPFTASTTIALLNNFGLYGAVVLVPMFFQQAGGKSPLAAGAIMVAQGVGAAVAVLLVGRLIDAKSNPRALVLFGLLLVAVGLTTFAMADTASASPLLLGALLVQGIGLALTASPIMVTLYHSLPPTSVPAATTANAISQQLGGAVGTTVIALLLQHYLSSGDGVTSAFQSVFWWALAFVILTALPALLLPAGQPKRS